MVGQTISHYKITDKLGEGGMGVVYKAEDTKLDRTVALKFLAEHLLNDEEAKARFLREAKAAAALDHPNICTVYEISEAEGKTFLSMAFIEGEPLEARIDRGPLPLKEALDIGRQIADGLEAAHEKGVVHRDIKPANVMVDAKDRATIMDFGLAHLTEASRLTKADQTMGTVAYMSPEQAQGMEVDNRSDVWALGVVLYEMVRGQRPFQGEYDQALLFEIVHQEPEPLTGVRAGVPMELEFIVGKCLAKDPADRYGNASEVAKDLRTLGEKLKSGHSTILRTSDRAAGVPATMTAGQTVNPIEALLPDAVLVRRGRQRLERVLTAVLAAALLGVLAIHFSEAAPEAPVRRFSFSQGGLSNAAISPDGRYVAFVAQADGVPSLWLRSLASETAVQIPGTEGARNWTGGWSPDSRSIVFATQDQLKRVSIEGVDAVRLCELPERGGAGLLGASWSPDGERIVFSSGNKPWEVSARGGEPRLLFEGEGNFRWPHFLPAAGGSQGVVYARGYAALNNQRIVATDLESGEHNEIGPGSWPVYSASGYLLHNNEFGLAATPFSIQTLAATGDTFSVQEAGERASLSQDGTLVYLDRARGGDTFSLVWRNRAGELLDDTIGQPQPSMTHLALSPDGRWLAVAGQEGGNEDVWIHGVERPTKTRLTFADGFDRGATWSPNGRDIAFASTRNGQLDIFSKPADGSGKAVPLVATPLGEFVTDWSTDGQYLLYDRHQPGATLADIWYLKRKPDGSGFDPFVFLETPFQERAGKFSPDGRYVVYASNETGQYEVYVRSFPSGEGKWQVSVNGGSQPRWSRDGKEIWFLSEMYAT